MSTSPLLSVARQGGLLEALTQICRGMIFTKASPARRTVVL